MKFGADETVIDEPSINHPFVSNTTRISLQWILGNGGTWLLCMASYRSHAFSELVPFMFRPTSLGALLLSVQHKSLMEI